MIRIFLIYLKIQKKILWMHNTLAIEKALRKKKLLSIIKNKINAVFVSKYLEKRRQIYIFLKNIVIIPNNFLSNKFTFKKYNYKSFKKNNFIWSVQREKGLKKTLETWVELYLSKKNKKNKLFIFGIDFKKKLNLFC